MPKKRQAWEYVTVGSATVPIYFDVIRRKGIAQDRYRVPKILGKRPKQHFYNDPKAARAYAKQRAKDIDAGHKIARLEEGDELIDRALTAQKKVGEIGEQDFVPIVTVWVDAQLKLGALSVFGDPVTIPDLLQDALARLRAMRGRKPQLVSELMEDYYDALDLARQAKNMCESDWKRAHAQMGRFLRAFGHRYIHTITDEELTLYYQNYYAHPDEPHLKTVGKGTVIQYRNDDKKFFEWARDMKKALPSKVDVAPLACELYGFLKAKDHRQMMLMLAGKDPLSGARTDSVDVHTAEEVQRVLDFAWHNKSYRKWVPLLAIWYFAGLHFTEILQMRWKDLKRQRREMWVDAVVAGGKHHQRTAFFSPAHCTWFDPFIDLLDGDDTQLIAPGMKTTTSYASMHNKFMRDFKKICARAYVPFRRNGRRDSFASHHFVLTNNVRWTCERLGSGESNFWDHYFHHVEVTDAEAYQRIARPGADDFRSMDARSWLPKIAFQSREQARIDLDQIARDEREGKRFRFWIGRARKKK
jgi:site-specific recombinase XerD